MLVRATLAFFAETEGSFARSHAMRRVKSGLPFPLVPGFDTTWKVGPWSTLFVIN